MLFFTLTNAVRDLERSNRQSRSSRIKIVEHSDSTVRDIMTRNYPQDKIDCNDPLCFPCSTSSGTYSTRNISCRRPGVGYRISCLLCKNSGEVAAYQGESGRNMYARGKDHLQGLAYGTASNCLVIHNDAHNIVSRESHFIIETTQSDKSN